MKIQAQSLMIGDIIKIFGTYWLVKGNETINQNNKELLKIISTGIEYNHSKSWYFEPSTTVELTAHEASIAELQEEDLRV